LVLIYYRRNCCWSKVISKKLFESVLNNAKNSGFFQIFRGFIVSNVQKISKKPKLSPYFARFLLANKPAARLPAPGVPAVAGPAGYENFPQEARKMLILVAISDFGG